MAHFFRECPEFVDVMCFTYSGEPIFCTLFPDTEIVKKYGSGPGPEYPRHPGSEDFVFGLVSSLKH